MYNLQPSRKKEKLLVLKLNGLWKHVALSMQCVATKACTNQSSFTMPWTLGLKMTKLWPNHKHTKNLQVTQVITNLQTTDIISSQ
jgi:hypothetical protein